MPVAGQLLLIYALARNTAGLALPALAMAESASPRRMSNPIAVSHAKKMDREIQIWVGAPVTQRNTMKEAQDYVRYYVIEKGDDEAVENLLRI